MKRKRSSKFKGVWFHPTKNRYVARCRIQGGPNHIGMFIKELDAAKAYDRVAFSLHANPDRLNFPKEYVKYLK